MHKKCVHVQQKTTVHALYFSTCTLTHYMYMCVIYMDVTYSVQRNCAWSARTLNVHVSVSMDAQDTYPVHVHSYNHYGLCYSKNREKNI